MTTTELIPEARVRIATSVYTRSFGKDIVLLDFKRGEYFGLDDVGAEIWKGVEAGGTVRAIAETLVERYEVTIEQALSDVVALLSQMEREHLIERV